MEVENYKFEGERLRIHTYPDPVLKKIAEPVTTFDDELKSLVLNMLYTMYKAPGIGLAAPQVGVSKRLFVMDIDYEREKEIDENGEEKYVYSGFAPAVFINPEFKEKKGETLYQEGCLSLPGVFEEVKRCESMVVSYQDWDGNQCEIEVDGLRGICMQHENDHLDGVVFLDRLSRLKKQFYVKKLIKGKQA